MADESEDKKLAGEVRQSHPSSGEELPFQANMAAARLVFIQTLGLNILVSVAKIVWGYISNTLSMIADGFHSLLDATSNIIGIVGLTIAMKPPDPGHPYGHRKFEAMSAIAISFFMFLTSFEIISQVIERLFSAKTETPVVSPISYAIMLVTALINVFVTRYEHKKGDELKSPLLIADSKHTLSDVFVTAIVFVTLVSVQLKIPHVDVIASLVIVGFILKAGYDIIVTHIGSLVDAAVLDPAAVEELALQVPGVIGCHRIRSRGSAEHMFIDMHVLVSRNLTIEEAHRISYAVEQKLQSLSPTVDVLVHIEDDRHELPD